LPQLAVYIVSKKLGRPKDALFTPHINSNLLTLNCFQEFHEVFFQHWGFMPSETQFENS
jgi:hypothetical protein